MSIDEQMLPYFGRHSGKMYMHGKPVKFGYKLWIVASHTGYPFHMMLYSGKEKDKSPGDLLGTRVIFELLHPIREPLSHTVTFDNFFTSYDVLVKLQEKGFAALGTVRHNRLRGSPLPIATDVK
ncbi:piggyBac transposable element-derived protein 3-like [Gigantopelta aegis]|uniref:piggyBac transposable element-derived protein 3-like n=1 Tax=Gigantopelta aegis TaxID=1735272 RepID=UPI001B8895AA|nr:piggyBac transposable element-derived protein 3-like [Gigantopelta aegis]